MYDKGQVLFGLFSLFIHLELYLCGHFIYTTTTITHGTGRLRALNRANFLNAQSLGTINLAHF
ncbi:hypothetical protein BDV12DRAFT_168836 [Aspergillus spectabilis]